MPGQTPSPHNLPFLIATDAPNLGSATQNLATAVHDRLTQETADRKAAMDARLPEAVYVGTPVVGAVALSNQVYQVDVANLTTLQNGVLFGNVVLDLGFEASQAAYITIYSVMGTQVSQVGPQVDPKTEHADRRTVTMPFSFEVGNVAPKIRARVQAGTNPSRVVIWTVSVTGVWMPR